MRISILVAFTLVTIGVKAQDTLKIASNKPSKFGVMGGANLSYLFAQDAAGETPSLGYMFGIYMNLPLSEKVLIRPEILYTDNGSKIKYNNNVQGQGEYRFSLNYIQIPVLLHVKLGDVVSIHAGPYISFLSNTAVKRKDVNNNAVSIISGLQKSDFNSTDFGASAGIGFDINKYNIGLRYNYGFNEVGKAGEPSGDDIKNGHNGVLNLYIAFGF